jgi:hypothetical protein
MFMARASIAVVLVKQIMAIGIVQVIKMTISPMLRWTRKKMDG